jgi:hypothetical protein
MARQITIEFEMPSGVQDRNRLVHRIRNFGEDLYRLFSRSGEAKIDLREIDRTADRILVGDIKTRKLRTVASAIEKMLEQQNLSGVARLSEDRAQHPD